MLGSYTLTYRVTDAFGLSQTVTRLVNVGDTTRPVITPRNAPGKNYYEHQIGRAFDILDAVTITDNYWPLANIDVEVSGTVDVNSPGTYILRYRARDGRGNIANEVFVSVVVIDRVAPTVVLNGLPDMEVEVFTAYEDPGVTVTDNYWPRNTILVTVRGNLNTNVLGTYTRWYIATDPSGNSDSISRIIRVVDRTRPIIQILGDNPFNLPRWQVFNDPGVSISDNYDKEDDLRPRLTVTNNLPVNAEGKPFGDYPGLFSVTYRVTDLSGNTSQAVQRLINVLEETTGIRGVMVLGNMVNVYPNPAKGFVNVRLVEAMQENVIIKLMDIQGKEIIRHELNQSIIEPQQVNIEQLVPGMYFVNIQIGNKQFVAKLKVH
jgi:hypothetical protein